MARLLRLLLWCLLVMAFESRGHAVEDGYDLWLRYRAAAPHVQARMASSARCLVTMGPVTPSVQAAMAELQRGVSGMTGRDLPISNLPCEGALLLATPDALPAIRGWGLPLQALGQEGYLLRSTRWQGKAITVITANSPLGLLYGSFAWLRAAQSGVDLRALNLQASPRVALRVLNHWDNLDRSVERGYAGSSIWDWWGLPDMLSARYVDYARANASLGINGTVLNNVNARAESLTQPWLIKAAALADVFRPYGVRVYLSARFSAPMEIGGLSTADPLDPEVRRWWRLKADEIYRLIPDFGGFLVKANSEGQPGPQDYRRSHADGANMLAEALAPHGGKVMWRAFVYSPTEGGDRARQAFDEFKPLDGQFAANVIVQVKNGPIDFQPREPFHPLFGAMPRSAMALEVQLTKEYLGFARHLVFLGPLFEEVLNADTLQQGLGTSVARVIAGGGRVGRPGAMAGVANIGSDRNWTGSHFDQANWYAFGRMAWDPDLSALAVAREWIRQTFSTDSTAVDAIAEIMMASREAAVDYMTPLGLHHLMGTGHHHGPAPWVADLERADWNPVYFHRASRHGIGFDRTRSGSGAVDQYAPPWASRLGNVGETPEKLLLWFHHLPWEHRMLSGRTVWHELVRHYDHGVQQVANFRRRWEGLHRDIDAARHAEVAAALRVQEREARWWRDACIAYFQSVNGLPLPEGVRPPDHSLEHYKNLRFPFAPGSGG